MQVSRLIYTIFAKFPNKNAPNSQMPQSLEVKLHKNTQYITTKTYNKLQRKYAIK